MVFEPFLPLSPPVLPTGFIRSVSHLRLNNELHLLYCHFETSDFSEHCFSLYDINQPDIVRKAVAKRKAEFLAARVLVKLALQALGCSEVEQQIQNAEDRSPVWPAGVTGSITHTTGFAACCVGTISARPLIGIDSELLLSVDTAQHLSADIHNQAELQLLLQAGLSAAVATTLIFSAKESLYKALYPVVRSFFGFEMARLSRVEVHCNSLWLNLDPSFAGHYGVKPQYRIQFCLKHQLVHTLLLQ